MKRSELFRRLEERYESYNRRDYVNPDPLQCVYRYTSGKDQEIAGLIAATLAYGRAAQIMESTDKVFDRLGESPRETLLEADAQALHEICAGFKHRWTGEEDLFELLAGIRSIISQYGTLENGFVAGLADDAVDTHEALIAFSKLLRRGGPPTSLVVSPEKGSASKRMHLYLRWMVRHDDVDLGCWEKVPQRLLIVPLDTHMYKISRKLKLLKRKQPDMVAARELTAAFRKYVPEDPLRYDFVITRFGIRDDMGVAAWLNT